MNNSCKLLLRIQYLFGFKMENSRKVCPHKTELEYNSLCFRIWIIKRCFCSAKDLGNGSQVTVLTVGKRSWYSYRKAFKMDYLTKYWEDGRKGKAKERQLYIFHDSTLIFILCWKFINLDSKHCKCDCKNQRVRDLAVRLSPRNTKSLTVKPHKHDHPNMSWTRRTPTNMTNCTGGGKPMRPQPYTKNDR